MVHGTFFFLISVTFENLKGVATFYKMKHSPIFSLALFRLFTTYIFKDYCSIELRRKSKNLFHLFLIDGRMVVLTSHLYLFIELN